jgi:hypothetical protein
VYYVIDTTVLIGLATIIVTGLIISTWFNLALTNYALWKSLHVIGSIGTLAAVVIKLGLHWRWIVATARRYIFPQPAQPAPVPVANGLGRREFLRLMGGVSMVAAIAAGSAVEALKQTTTSDATADTSSAQSKPTTQTTAPTTSSTSNKTVNPSTANSASAPSTSSCERCPKNRHCSYPGQCRRYTDSNNNGRCDLGECA